MKTMKVIIPLSVILMAGAILFSCQKEQNPLAVNQQGAPALKYSDSWFTIDNEVCFGETAHFCFTYTGTRTTQIQKETTPGTWVQIFQKSNSAQYCDDVNLGVTTPGVYKFRYNVSGPGGPQIIFTITVHALPTAVLTGDATICSGDCATLSVELTGTAPWTITYSDGITGVTLSDIQSSPYTFEVCPASTTTYYLTGVDDSHCTGTSFTGNATVTVIDCQECSTWLTHTAFGGDAAGAGAAWWYYYDGIGIETVWAGQTINAGTVEWSGGVMYITLNNGWELNNSAEPVKIQGYSVLPTSRPAAGQFTTYKGTSLNPPVDAFPYYVVHLDVRKCMDN